MNKDIAIDDKFPVKLTNCIDSVHALKVISTATLNQSENTVKIVKYVMTNGLLNVFRNNKKCEYSISY